MTAASVPGTPIIFVLFGATGDLAKRMVIPAFFTLAQQKLLPDNYLLIGNGRGDVSHEEFRKHVHDTLRAFGPHPDAVEDELPGGGAGDAELLLQARHLEPGRARLDDEGRDAAMPGVGARLREDGVEPGDAGVRDEALRAVEHPAVAVRARR